MQVNANGYPSRVANSLTSLLHMGDDCSPSATVRSNGFRIGQYRHQVPEEQRMKKTTAAFWISIFLFAVGCYNGVQAPTSVEEATADAVA